MKRLYSYEVLKIFPLSKPHRIPSDVLWYSPNLQGIDEK